jgi:hypothetical protein
VTTPLGAFGPPADPVAWVAFVLALLALAGARRAAAIERFLAQERRHAGAIVGLAVLAALLSSGYVAYYLRGGPRIVDATSYYLQARALAEGHFAFPVPTPTASFRGRFLLANADGTSLSTIFPPGYPAVLALGFLAGAPMAVGPVLAALIVVVTARLAKRVTGDDRVALLAALLSAICAALRYHTADTMSHGWSALLFALSILAALGVDAKSAAVAGASAGALIATRPVTGIVAMAIASLSVRSRPRHLLLLWIASAPFVLLFLVEQRAATGAWLRSAQSAYYALADFPADCFRFGFGEGIGCRFEHGDFVRAHLEGGYGLAAALGTTLRRLALHLADAGNIELFAPLLLLAARDALPVPKLRAIAAAPIALIVAYAPFYFDGNYPGGGARFFADALPFEHVLLAVVLLRVRLARFAPALALAGFAWHESHAHLALRDREGGRPMYEPSVVASAGISHGLVFVDTDHGFSLGHDPAVRDAARGVVVARRRRDARDALLWDRLGRPPAFFYEYAPGNARSTPRLSPLTLSLLETPRFEAEAEYPVLALSGGSAVPTFPPCASNARALSLTPDSSRELRVRLELPAARAGRFRVRTGWAAIGLSGAARIQVGATSWAIRTPAPGPRATCTVDDGPLLTMGQRTEFMDVFVSEGIALDYVELRPEP